MEQGSLGHQPAAPTSVPPGPAGKGQAAAQGQGAQVQGAQGQGAQGQQGQALEADVQAHLGRQLRAVYDEMASQPVPDRFIELLDALERKSQRKPASVTGATKAGDI